MGENERAEGEVRTRARLVVLVVRAILPLYVESPSESEHMGGMSQAASSSVVFA